MTASTATQAPSPETIVDIAIGFMGAKQLFAASRVGLFSALALSGHATALLGTGFCGGLTTYSSFAVQTHGLGLRRGAMYAGGTIVLALAACTVGFVIGQA